MRYLPFIGLMIILICYLVYAGENQTQLIGNWKYEGKVTKITKEDNFVECPDIIQIKNDGSYIVLNDCYGLDLNSDVVETGKWEFVKISNKLILKDRKSKGDQFIYSSDIQLELNIISVDEKTLKVKYKGIEPELYSKIN